MKRTVLFVDDEPRVLFAAMRNFRKQSFEMLFATDAKTARFILLSQQVDLIVTDETMPGQSGTELLKWVAMNLPDVVRIILTGKQSVETAINAINEAGVFRFLQKPCRPFDLAIAIHEGLDSIQNSSEPTELENSGSSAVVQHESAPAVQLRDRSA